MSFVLNHGSDEDLARCHFRLQTKLTQMDEKYLLQTENRYRTYLQKLRETINDGMYPYEFESNNPASVLSTALALSRLLEFDLVEDSLTSQIISKLIEIQNSNGWWRDLDEILDIPDLPFYQDPSNASVRIFNSMFIASSLAHIKTEVVSNALLKSSDALNKVTSSNGVIPGFPQSSWFATKMLARIHGINSTRFLLHWSVLSDLADKISDPGSLSSIAENLLEAGVPRYDPLIEKCKRKILYHIETSNIDGVIYQGWSDTSNKLDTATTLRCLIVLLDEDDPYLSKYKIE